MIIVYTRILAYRFAFVNRKMRIILIYFQIFYFVYFASHLGISESDLLVEILPFLWYDHKKQK